MRFEVSYRTGSTHEVELAAVVAVLGRDPSCDVVLNDSRCSRRHARIEDGPGGLSITDEGSANGTFVNGRRVEQAPLVPGDTIRLGDVRLRLLPEIGDTVVVATEELEAPPAPAAAPPVRAAAAPARAAAAPARAAAAPPPAAAGPAGARSPASARPAAAASLRPRAARPLTVSFLAALWALALPVSVAAILYAASRLGGTPGWTAGAVLALAAAGLCAAMALGLRSVAPWARHLQIAAAAVGLLACPFTLASATVLVYMTRPEVKGTFEPRPGSPRAGAGAAEPTFALSILVMLALGAALAAGALALLRPGR